jgi:hypothetical protein
MPCFDYGYLELLVYYDDAMLCAVFISTSIQLSVSFVIKPPLCEPALFILGFLHGDASATVDGYAEWNHIIKHQANPARRVVGENGGALVHQV